MAMTAKQILDREYLELRAKILELAASFDRLERADADGEEAIDADPRSQKLAKGLDILRSNEGNRAERVQLLFSLAYSDSWREDFQLVAK
ncbi:hypothetical protein ACFL2H_11310 [Planctomycetota bacterium]